MIHGIPPVAEWYRDLLQGPPVAMGSLAVRETPVETPAGRVVLGIGPERHQLLLIPVSEKQDNKTLEWSNRSVAFGYRTVAGGHPQSDFLVLECLNQRLASTFVLLAEDILMAIAQSPTDPVGATRATVERWRALLREERRPFLSDDALIGLLAELLFLEELADLHGALALTAWAGPSSGRHDFVTPNIDIEVKATTSKEDFRVGIHGAEQLAAAPGVDLYLRGYRFEPHPAGDSVPDALARLHRMGIDRLDLLRLTELVGYSELDSEYYRARTFSRLEQKTCLVGDGFPRLTAETVDENLLSQISRLSYSIDLATHAEANLDPGLLHVSQQ